MLCRPEGRPSFPWGYIVQLAEEVGIVLEGRAGTGVVNGFPDQGEGSAPEDQGEADVTELLMNDRGVQSHKKSGIFNL